MKTPIKFELGDIKGFVYVYVRKKLIYVFDKEREIVAIRKNPTFNLWTMKIRHKETRWTTGPIRIL